MYRQTQIALSRTSAVVAATSDTIPNHRLLAIPAVPLVFLFNCLGVGGVAIAFNLSRAGQASSADFAYVVAILIALVPTAWFLFGKSATPGQRFLMLATFGLTMYAMKFLYDPLNLTFHDELVHWRTANAILQFSRLFDPNPTIPTSALYPGLEILTTALSSLSGLSVFAAGTIVLGAARLVLVASLFLFYTSVSHSSRLAGIAVLVYMGNPSFGYFDAQFSYESLAVPIAIFLLCLVPPMLLNQQRAPLVKHFVLMATGLALVMTHHLTSYAFVAFFLAWSVIFLVKRKYKGTFNPIFVTLYLIGACAVWLYSVASFTLSYLSPFVFGAVTELVNIIGGEATGRQLFQSSSGIPNPLWEQLVGYLAVILIGLALLVGWYRVYRRGIRQISPLSVALFLGAFGYPLSQVFRFTVWGAEAAERMSGYLFLAVGFVVAYGIVKSERLANAGTALRMALVGCLGVIIIGGIVVGTPRWARMPGPYLVAADQRSVEREGVDTALWAKNNLPPNSHIAGDRVNNLLMLSYGNQRVVTAIFDKILVAPVYFAPTFTSSEEYILRAAGVEYLLVDKRLSTGLPYAEVYIERGEPNSYDHRQPFDLNALLKFDSAAHLYRVFDSGDIVLYDTHEILNEVP